MTTLLSGVKRCSLRWTGLVSRWMSTNVTIMEDRKKLKHIKQAEVPPPHSPVKYSPDWPYPTHGITEEKAKNYEANKLHMVTLVQSLRGRPAWEKHILAQLRLYGKKGKMAILKNTPGMNNTLWKVKHLISVKPITFPNGLPEPGDYVGTKLKHNGEFVVKKKLKELQGLLQSPEEFERSRMDRDYIKRHLLLKWQGRYD